MTKQWKLTELHKCHFKFLISNIRSRYPIQITMLMASLDKTRSTVLKIVNDSAATHVKSKTHLNSALLWAAQLEGAQVCITVTASAP